MGPIDLIIFALYMVGMIVIGFIAQGKIETMDDFILGGRRFGLVALVGTIMATMIGSGMTMGAVGNAYKAGAGGTVFWMYTGFSIGLLYFGYIAGKIRETGKRTVAEVLSAKFGNNTRLISSIVIIGYAVSIVAINIAGLRNVIFYVFGSKLGISLPLATTIAAAICILYTSLGGFYAVVWTDVVQFGLMLLGIVILGPIIGLNSAGGFNNVVLEYEKIGSSITNPFINGISSGSIGFFLAYFLTVPGDPTMPQRALAAKDEKSAKISFYISGVLGFFFGFALLIMGGSAFVLMPGLENPESAMLLFISEYYPPILKGLSISAIVAAIMSSFDSFLILATTHLVYDVGSSLNKDVNEEKMKKLLPKVTIVIGILGLIIALFIQSLFDYLYMVFSIIGSSLVPAIIAALYYSDKTTSKAVVASIVTGAVVPGALYLTYGYDVFLGDPVFLGIIASTLVLIIGSIVTKDKIATK
jgi:SSS family solute:Na+ symporter